MNHLQQSSVSHRLALVVGAAAFSLLAWAETAGAEPVELSYLHSPLLIFDGPRAAPVTSDGSFVQVVALSGRSLLTFERDASDGSLTGIDIERNGQDGITTMSRSAGGCVSPDGRSDGLYR